jgi:hypothetical protein
MRRHLTNDATSRPSCSTRLGLALVVLVSVVSACGGSTHTAAPGTTAAVTAPTNPPTSTRATTTATTSSSGPGALQAEANSAAAGDIPDNQVFLVFVNRAAGYSIKYPEGWAQQGAGGQVTFRDKNNIVRIVIGRGAAPTQASVRADVARLAGARVESPAQAMTISSRPALKVVYSTESAPNAVTGKRVKLVVDRYYLWQRGRHAVVDLGTPVGVDNVDAYRLMIESFRWR